MLTGLAGDAPAQSQIMRCNLGLTNTKKNVLLNSYKGQVKKHPLLDSNNINYLHPLAKDVYADPTLFIHGTDLYL
jgi:hypothetical protein